MKELFGSGLERLYSICTVIVIAMTLFPPTFGQLGGTRPFQRFKFLLTLDVGYHIDVGRLFVQYVLLAAIAISVRRVLVGNRDEK